MSQSLDGQYELIPRVRFIIGAIALICYLIATFAPDDFFVKRLAMIVSALCMGVLISQHLSIWRKYSP